MSAVADDRTLKSLDGYITATGVFDAYQKVRVSVTFLFLRLMGERTAVADKYTWTDIKDMSAKKRVDVMPVIGEWLAEAMEDERAVAHVCIPQLDLLDKIINLVDRLHMDGLDVLGDAYETLLTWFSANGHLGQCRTQPHVAELLVSLVNPQPGEVIGDPACGSSGLLVKAHRHVTTNGGVSPILLGSDIDETMTWISHLNMRLIGQSPQNILRANSLTDEFPDEWNGHFDVIIANPPFNGILNPASLAPELQGKGNKTEILFLHRILTMLKTGGRAAVIVPEGVLFGSSRAHKELRRKLVHENRLEAVISLPGGVFLPTTNVKTSILVFTKGGVTDRVFMYDAKADGYALNKNRQPIEQNDLWDLLLRYCQFRQLPAPAFANGTWTCWNQTAWDNQQKYAHLNNREQHLQVVTIQQEEEPKAWQVMAADLGDDLNLTVSRYKPETATNKEVLRTPKELIEEAMRLQTEISYHLSKLLETIENP